MDTIREKIIQQIELSLKKITVANGYNTDMGLINVQRAKTQWDESALPAISIFPKLETAERKQGGGMLISMPVEISGYSVFGSTNPSEVAEEMLGDLILNILGPQWKFNFNIGKSEIFAGNTITGKVSGATAVIVSVTKSTGTWAGGDAAGYIIVRDIRGTFELETVLVGAVESLNLTSGPIIQTRFGNYVFDVGYESGGTENYPQPGEVSVGVIALFNFRYITVNNNPYIQPS